MYSTKADILQKKGDTAAAKALLEEALRYAESLPKAQVSSRSIESLKAKLAR